MLTLPRDMAAPRPAFLTALVWPTLGHKEARDGGSRADPEKGRGDLERDSHNSVLQGVSHSAPRGCQSLGRQRTKRHIQRDCGFDLFSSFIFKILKPLTKNVNIFMLQLRKKQGLGSSLR